MIHIAQQRGYILLPVVILITLVATTAFLLNNETALDSGITASKLELKQAEQIARAGIEHASWGMQNSGCAGDVAMTTVPFGEAGIGSYTATVTTPGGGTTAYPNLAVDQDAWFRSDNITANNGTSASHHLRRESGNLEYAVLRFDLSTLPAGAQVNSATARFYVKATKGHPQGAVNVHRVTADWTETGATWETMATSYNSGMLSTIPPQPQAGGIWISINLTAQVQAWVNGGEPNYGIMLIPTGEGTHAEYISREGAASEQPRLDVIVGSGAASPMNISVTGMLTGSPSPAKDISRTLERTAVPAYQPPGHSLLQLQPGSGKDAMLSYWYDTKNYGDYRLRVTSPGSSPRNSLLQFELAAVPAGARVLSAQLQLYHTITESPGADAGVSVHRMTRDWVEGTQSGAGTADGATWLYWDGSNAWSSAGGDDDLVAVANSPITDATGDWESWDISSLVQGWLDGTFANNGLLLKGTGTVAVSFASKEDADPILRPRLSITYACECGNPCLAPQGSGNILMVVSDEFNMTAGEKARLALFESWGYVVDLISQWDVSWNFDAKALINDVVYVSEAVTSSTFGMAPKLAATSLGVISEEGELNDELGIAAGSATPVDSAITIVDNSHYITAPFASGSLSMYAAAMEQLTVSGGEAPGLQTLADSGAAGSLVVLDTGAMGTGGTPLAGRRVMLPLGREAGFNWDYLNGNGRLLVQRALQWGTGNTGSVVTDSIMLSTDSAATLGGLTFDDIDLAEYEPDADSASLFFEGALTTLNTDIDALHVLGDGRILLSTKDAATLGGLSFEDGDLVQYDPATDTAEWYFDESAFSADEDIVSVYVMNNGHILLSTDSDATLGGLSFTDNDLVEYDTGSDTATLYFDGSTVSLNSDIDAVHLLENGHIVLSTRDNANLGGLSFNDGDLVEYDPDTDTAAVYFSEGLFAGGEDVISAHIGPGSGDSLTGNRLLLVVVNPSSLSVQEAARKTLIESWLYTVSLIDESDSPANFNTAIAANDVAYIPQGINATNLGTKLANASIGVVNEEGEQVDELGFASDKLFKNRFQIDIIDNSHYITETFATGLLTFVSSNQPVHMLGSSLAPGLSILATSLNVGSQWEPSLATLDAGDELSGGGNAAGRRVQLPWGGGSFDINQLTGDGRTIMQRAIEWGAGSVAPIAHWKFDEGTGPTAFDSVGGNDATLNGSPGWTTGTLGEALDFNGTGDYVTTDINFTPPPIGTVTFWMQVSGSPASHGSILGLDDSWEIRHVTTGTPDGIPYGLVFDLGVTGGNTDFVTTTTVDTPGQWYHIAASYNTTNDAYAVYIDGVPHKSGTYTSALAVPAAGLLSIGTRTGSTNYFDGLLDDVRIYDHFLTAAEIAGLASTGGGSSPAACDGTFRDEYSLRQYDQNDGTLSWTTDWQETGETSDPTGGDIFIANDTSNYQLVLRDDGQTVWREADLSTAGSASLSFDYRRENLSGTGDYVAVEVSYNGGSSWTELDRFTGSATDASYTSTSYVLDAGSLSVNTRIRLLTPGSGMSDSNMVWFDNIQILCSP